MLGHQGEDGSARDRKLLKCCWFHFVSTGVSFSLKMACSVFKCDLVLFFSSQKKKKPRKTSWESSPLVPSLAAVVEGDVQGMS